MEAPSPDPSSTVVAAMRNRTPAPHSVTTGREARTVPSSSTMPVNMRSGYRRAKGSAPVLRAPKLRPPGDVLALLP